MSENRIPLSSLVDVIDSQQSQLDDTEYYASAWAEALRASDYGSQCFIRWGGKGKGGRDLSRKTNQPKDVIVEHVRLEFCSVSTNKVLSNDMKTSSNKSSSTSTGNSMLPLLDDAYLKLLNGHVYALIGPSGCGKSSLLRRMNSLKIPGFPAHLSTLYIPQEILLVDKSNYKADQEQKDAISTNATLTPIEFVMQQYNFYCKKIHKTSQIEVEMLETEMEKLDTSNEEDLIKMEELAKLIADLEDTKDNLNSTDNLQLVKDALQFFDIKEAQLSQALRNLSEGVLKKIALAVVLVVVRKSKIDLLLLDEPTSALDIVGLLKLRKLISFVTGDAEDITDEESSYRTSTIVLFVSHDIDFINSVATDIIDFYHHKLFYYTGNFADYMKVREQHDSHNDKMITSLNKKRDNIKQTISNMKKKKNTKRQIESHKKRFEREVYADYGKDQLHGSVSSSKRKYGDEPNKAIQFNFRKVLSQWNEPLIMAMDVGHGFSGTDQVVCPKASENDMQHFRKPDFLFDCVDLCIDEGGIYCILGENSCGKTSLLKLLAKMFSPLEGRVVYAKEVEVAYIDQFLVDSFIIDNTPTISQRNRDCNVLSSNLTALEYLTRKYPNKSNQDTRGELTNFGLSTPQQVSGTPLCYLSGGERRRFCFADCMLSNPHVLVIDEPTSNLDAESVDALIYGLRMWNGTVVMASHDCNFVRSLEANCFVLLAEEGKLYRVNGGIDVYLKSFSKIKTNRFASGN